jgi:hypothetical protein
MKKTHLFLSGIVFLALLFSKADVSLAQEAVSSNEPEITTEVQQATDGNDISQVDDFSIPVISEDELDLLAAEPGVDGWGVEQISGLNVIQLLNNQNKTEGDLGKSFSEKDLQPSVWYKHFLFGPSYGKARVAKDLIAQNTKNIEWLGKFSIKMPKGVQRQKLENVIMQKTKTNEYFQGKLDEFLNQKSLLGWLFRIFSGV